MPSSQPGFTRLPVQSTTPMTIDFLRSYNRRQQGIFYLSISNVGKVVKLAHAPLPLFFKLQLTRADP